MRIHVWEVSGIAGMQVSFYAVFLSGGLIVCLGRR